MLWHIVRNVIWIVGEFVTTVAVATAGIALLSKLDEWGAYRPLIRAWDGLLRPSPETIERDKRLAAWNERQMRASWGLAGINDQPPPATGRTASRSSSSVLRSDAETQG